MANEPQIPAKPMKGDVDATASALLLQVAKSKAAEQRISLSADLAALRPTPVAALKKYLGRTRSSSIAARRAILLASGAEVPDDSGRFKTPKRQTAKEKKRKDTFDWLPAIAKRPTRAGLGEAIGDVAAIRALAASTNPEAATVLLDFSFSDEGLIYRDECGRYLRKMSPYSLPALIHGSQNPKDRSMSRYSRYQLERLDRQDAHKAIASALTEELKIAIITAFADSQYREAVFAVLDNVDHVAPRVRAATRAAWTEFISGKEPPKPPERELELPNGKKSDDVEPLWLDHRALAKTAIRARLKELTGEKMPKAASLEALTEKLFSFYDDRRSKATNTDFEAGLTLATAGKSDKAIAIFDRILAQYPTFSRRSEMLPAYMSVAKKLESGKNWKSAAVAYGKASAIAPDDKAARDALQKHHLARASAARAAGEDNSDQIAMAEEVHTQDPKKEPSKKLTLFGGLAALAASFILLLLGLALRRRQDRGR
ncbi:MAG: hypothetical protein GY811_12675 [Myxococcales bacterium]|nr:hypothetical protein [Myxococcales bacterium]